MTDHPPQPADPCSSALDAALRSLRTGHPVSRRLEEPWAALSRLSSAVLGDPPPGSEAIDALYEALDDLTRFVDRLDAEPGSDLPPSLKAEIESWFAGSQTEGAPGPDDRGPRPPDTPS